MSDVIGLDWLRMFSSKELSTLIAGAEHEIDVADLQVRKFENRSLVSKIKLLISGPHKLLWRLRVDPPHHLRLLGRGGGPQRGPEARPAQVRHKLLTAAPTWVQGE